MSSYRRNITAPLASLCMVFIVAVLVYLPTIFHGFVYDDMEQVLGNPWILDLTHLGDIFFSPSWGFVKESVGSNYYRPLMHLVFLVEHGIFGFSPMGFHIVNVVLHALNAALVFLVVLLILRSRTVPLRGSLVSGRIGLDTILSAVAALLFATHPINSEVVSWVSAIPELTYTFFLLVAFYLYLTVADREPSARRTTLFVLSVMSFFIALLGKETAMAFLLFIWAYDFARFGRSFLRRVAYYIPYVIVAVIYLALRTYALGGAAQKAMVEMGLFEAVINICPIAVRYAAKLLWPSKLSIIYSFDPYYSFVLPAVLVSTLLVVIFLLALLALRKRRAPFFALIWMIVPILPVLYIPVVSVGGFADRYLYLPSAGLGLLLAVILGGLITIDIRLKKFAVIFSVCLIVLSAVLAYQRSAVWKDGLSLWSETVKTAPESEIVQLGLGAAYREAGELERAIEHYRVVVKLKPMNYKAHYNLALIYQGLGDVAQAAASYERTIRLNPANDRAYYNLAALYEKAGEIERAIYYYKETLRVNPANPLAQASLARAYKKSGNTAGMLASYEAAVKANSNDAQALSNLAWSYQEAGKIQSAVRAFKEAARLEPANDKPLYGLGWIFHSVGDLGSAEGYYKEAIRVNPANPDPHFNLAVIYAGRGNGAAAVVHFKKVLDIDPNYREAADRLRRAESLL